MSAAQVLHTVWARSAGNHVLPPPDGGPITPLAFYRKRTEVLLRAYMQKSMELGRTPSVLGRDVFQGRASHSRSRGFDDTVHFVLDIEKCLKRLDSFSQELIARIALQEYSHGETAGLTGQSLSTVVRRYTSALDTLTAILLDNELLDVGVPKPVKRANSF